MPVAHQTTTPRLRTAIVVAATLFMAFNANLRSINAVDTRTIQATAMAIAVSGRADLSRFPELATSGVSDGYITMVDGQALSSYPLLPALIAAPVYRAALAIGVLDRDRPEPERIEAVGALVASALVAVACALVYLLIAARLPRAPAAAIAIACGLATPLWSSASQALWSHGPASVLLALGLMSTLMAATCKRPGRALIVAGSTLIFAAFCRQLIAVFPACVLLGLWMRHGLGREVAWFSSGAIGAAAMMAALNLWFLGSAVGPLFGLYADGVNMTTHGVASAWSGNWAEGLLGVLLSPNRGLIVFTPAALVAAVGTGVAWREREMPWFAVAAPTLFYIALWAKYSVWWGGHSFGPRLAADIAVPLAILAAIALSHEALVSGWRRVAIAAVLTWSVAVQALGAFAYPSGDWNGRPRDVDISHDRLWDWRDSQIRRTIEHAPYRRSSVEP